MLQQIARDLHALHEAFFEVLETLAVGIDSQLSAHF